jgi:hypothetical protein
MPMRGLLSQNNKDVTFEGLLEDIQRRLEKLEIHLISNGSNVRKAFCEE